VRKELHGAPGLSDDRMIDAATYLIDGERLSADQCRTRFAALPLSDRQTKVMALLEGDTIVDVGGHTGGFVHAASRQFPARTIIGVDYVEDNIRIAQLIYPELARRFRHMSAYRLDFPQGSVDCIAMQEVLEHLEGAALAIKEASRVLKPDGALIVSVPNPYYAWSIAAFIGGEIANAARRRRGSRPRLSVEVFSPSVEWDRHVHGWTPRTLLTLLTVNGFEYVEHIYEKPSANRLRRLVLTVLPFLGPTLILKVRKRAAAPRELV
jgi:ubiquinone/menaquinone biosynthesis C-methylase UbiE